VSGVVAGGVKVVGAVGEALTGQRILEFIKSAVKIAVSALMTDAVHVYDL